MVNLDDNSRFAVIGYGSWATTLVGKLTQNGNIVRWHITNEEVIAGVQTDHCNPKYVSDMELDMDLLRISSDINEVVADSDVVILAVPSAFIKSVLSKLTESLEDKIIISAVKGIIPDEYLTVLEYVHQSLGVPFKNMGLISGPSHAEEVSRGRLSYLTAVCYSEANAALIASNLRSKSLVVDTSQDIYGIEYAALLKNIYAIAAGLAAGLGYGDNYLAVLVSACVAEMKAFLNDSYPFERDICKSAYMGDLLVTCYSTFSRNRSLGFLIGRGCTVKTALNEMTMVAEGYYAVKGMKVLNSRSGIQMPIVDTVYSILYEGLRPRKAFAALSAKL